METPGSIVNNQVKDAIYRFGTISLERDYCPSDDMLKRINTIFKTYVLVTERGKQGEKLHCHFVGECNNDRADNHKLSIKKQLVKEDYDVTSFSVDYIQERRVNWRIGYVLKDFEDYSPKTDGDIRLIYKGYTIEDLKACALLYKSNEKKERKTNSQKSGKLSINQIAVHMRECGYTAPIEPYDLSNEINKLIEDGRLDYSTYLKLNTKKLLQFLRGQHEF